MSSITQTSSAAIEGRLWSVRADDWAAIQERQVAPAYEAALDALRVGPSTRLLDAGCGAGMFLRLAADRGADVTGLDASEGLLAHARARVPGAPLLQADLEQLPYEDASFDIVTGFNSFQYARPPRRRARRSASGRAAGRPRVAAQLGSCGPVRSGRLFGRARCADAGTASRRLRGRSPYRTVDALKALFDEAGLDVVAVTDVECLWSYPISRPRSPA